MPCVDTSHWCPRLGNLCGFCRVQTQVLYRWVEPKICVENVTGAVELPAMGQREPCPPCNPGYYNSNDSTCLPCPPGTHSDGTNGKQAHTPLPWLHICPNHDLSTFMCTHLSVYHVSTILCGLFPPLLINHLVYKLSAAERGVINYLVLFPWQSRTHRYSVNHHTEDAWTPHILEAKNSEWLWFFDFCI